MTIVTDIALGLAFIAGTIALSIGAYLLMRRFTGGDPDLRHREMASAMIFRIGALHGLILALVFAQEMNEYQRLETQTANEASAIADIYNDAARYDRVALAPVQASMVAYLHIVVTQEWDEMGSTGELNADAWTQWDRAYDLVLDLNPANARQASLRDHMLERIHAIAASRNLREASGAGSIIGLFWFAAISGVVLIAVGHYFHPPERNNLLLMALFSAYTGIILFLIFAFSNPYRDPAALPPTQLQDLERQIGVAPQ